MGWDALEVFYCTTKKMDHLGYQHDTRTVQNLADGCTTSANTAQCRTASIVWTIVNVCVVQWYNN